MIRTNGGPLVVLPFEIVDAWRGTLPPHGMDVPPDWSWGSGDIVCDYDRACDEPERTFGVNDSFRAWPLLVAEHAALVLEGECSTTALRWDDGLVVARDVGLRSTRDLVLAIANVAGGDWFDTGAVLELPSGRLALFDAVYAGSERQDADGGVLEVTLAPGRYRVWLATPSPVDRTTFVRFRGAPQDDPRSLTGVLVL